MKKRRIQIIGAAVPLFALLAVVVFASCNSASATQEPRDPDLFGQPGYMFTDPDVEMTLTAEVTDWEVYEGETVEAWTFNGQYPGPTIRVQEGDKVRIHVENELPEATAVHWHGLDVPNDQDGVPGITQPDIMPGETWTYEFTAERVGTTAYHTHKNTVAQLSKGLFGTLIVEDPREQEYDHDMVMQLHEIGGNYTINGHSFPATADNDMVSVKEGETARIRFINMGSLYHPMHLHGHQMQVIAVDGNERSDNVWVNTVDVPPGQTVDVLVTAENPGTWVFHCHIISHVQNKGEYPGGMLTVIDYEDHTSYMEANPVPEENPADQATDRNGETGEELAADGALEIKAVDSTFDRATLEAVAGAETTVRLINDDSGVPHNISFYEDDSAEVAIAEGELFPGVATEELTFTAPAAGTYYFKCDVHPNTMTGELVVREE